MHRRDIGKGGRYDSKHCRKNTARSRTRIAVLSPSEIFLTWVKSYGHSSVKNARSLPRSISLWIPSLKFEPKVKKLSKKGGFQIESDNVDFDVFRGKTPRIVARAYHYFRVSGLLGLSRRGGGFVSYSAFIIGVYSKALFFNISLSFGSNFTISNQTEVLRGGEQP